MKEATPKTIKLSEYKAPDHFIDEVNLTIDLHDTATKVSSILKGRALNGPGKTIFLNGEELKFISAKLNEVELKEGDYQLVPEGLEIHNIPNDFVLEIQNEINPVANKALDGLYKSGTIFCTQNEPEGFRRITYYIDRPDVMAVFTTKVIADKKLYPVLLSNGNQTDAGDLDGNRHFATWHDPFKKPAYLYALVAGDLGLVRGNYTTMSGRKIDLRIYCDKGNESKCGHALESLKKSMKWDEDTFGLEYDLDIYMIVSVDSFNMGAMENKGLNIFNSALVLANPETATDDNFHAIESVVGHEYFHNWTGNRVTCRDWFQLTLKEGLTVYRDQEFSSDLHNRAVQRISDVDNLRSRQFVEDAGPTSHPIKPSTYIEINNFYTATVYEKGAEVIRMIATLLGKEGFRKGMDEYFKRHDGQAVTTEDFVAAMGKANPGHDFAQFVRWYSQAGTPELSITWDYDKKEKTFKLNIAQSCPATPESVTKEPFHIPLRLGLLGADGKDLELDLKSSTSPQKQIGKGLIELFRKEESFVFKNVETVPVVSINRGFSAPVKIAAPHSEDELAFLMANDSDEFNRYEAGQELAGRVIKGLLADIENKRELELNPIFAEAWGKVLKSEALAPAIKSLCLELPNEAILHQGFNPVNFHGIYKARTFVLTALAKTHKATLVALYESLATAREYKIDAKAVGERELKNRILSMLALTGDFNHFELANRQFSKATNMTDELGALKVLVHNECPQRDAAIESFYNKWKHETLVMQKWLVTQAGAPLEHALDDVKKLEGNKVYDKSVPNLFRSLWGSFAMNYTQFHHPTGRGYKAVADSVMEVDKINPQMASRVVGAFKDFKRLPKELAPLMKTELERILATEKLSKNTFEIASKILNA